MGGHKAHGIGLVAIPRAILSGFKNFCCLLAINIRNLLLNFNQQYVGD
jgi:hypothetical protein